MTGSSLVVWYNTRCPVCDAGIDWQRNRLVAAVRAGKISFKDINDEPDALAAYGASLDDVRRRLHATDEAGRLIVGADVAIAMWRATPGEGWLASLFGNPQHVGPQDHLPKSGKRYRPEFAQNIEDVERCQCLLILDDFINCSFLNISIQA